MEKNIKQVIKRIDNIRNNLLHSIDNIMAIGVSEEDYNNLVSEKIDILSDISAFRAKTIKVLNKLNKKD